MNAGGLTHTPPRPRWAAEAALLALGSPRDPALDYTNLTLRTTLRYATLLLLARCCCSSPAAAAPSSRPPRLRPSISPASCARFARSASRCLLRMCVVRLVGAAAYARAARCCAACVHPFKNLRHPHARE